MIIIKIMNKKLLLIVAAILILAAAFFIFQNSSNLPSQKPVAESPVQNTESVTVDLAIKTPNSASDSASVKVELPSGSDHCEVLKKALEQGRIKDLDMRYQEKYQTNGVYVINGIGKTDSPWWVYKINGADAPSGCSQIKVAPGDKILWEYIGE